MNDVSASGAFDEQRSKNRRGGRATLVTTAQLGGGWNVPLRRKTTQKCVCGPFSPLQLGYTAGELAFACQTDYSVTAAAGACSVARSHQRQMRSQVFFDLKQEVDMSPPASRLTRTQLNVPYRNQTAAWRLAPGTWLVGDRPPFSRCYICMHQSPAGTAGGKSSTTTATTAAAAAIMGAEGTIVAAGGVAPAAADAAAAAAGGDSETPPPGSSSYQHQGMAGGEGQGTAAAVKAASSSSAAGAAAGRPSSWRHVGLLWLACALTVGAYFSKDVLAAVSTEVRILFWLLLGLPACLPAARHPVWSCHIKSPTPKHSFIRSFIRPPTAHGGLQHEPRGIRRPLRSPRHSQHLCIPPGRWAGGRHRLGQVKPRTRALI
jgi:hypothetical protein